MIRLSETTGIPVVNLYEVKEGRNGGTWIHPRLSVRFTMWLNDDFSLQVEDWVHSWLRTGQNPVKSNTKTSAQRDLERFEERIRLKDEARLALSDVIKEWMEYHGWYHDRKRVSKYFIALMDGINVAITTETSQQMQKRLAAQLGRKPKSGELIRDYFPVEELRLYLSVHNVLTNLLLMVPIGERNGLQYLNQAIALALPRKFQATPISFETQSYLQGSQTELALA